MADEAEDDKDKSEGFEAYDPLLAERGIGNPWQTADDGRRIYVPDLDLLRDMVAIPVGKGQARQQQSGRVAKAFDAWIAHELRRAGFPAGAVWPRTSRSAGCLVTTTKMPSADPGS